MPVLSVLERLWYYLSFTQLSLWHLLSQLAHSLGNCETGAVFVSSAHSLPDFSVWRKPEIL